MYSLTTRMQQLPNKQHLHTATFSMSKAQLKTLNKGMVYESCREGSTWCHSSFPVPAPVTAPYTPGLNCSGHAGASCPCPALPSRPLLPGPSQVPPGTGAQGHWVNAVLGSAELSPGHSPTPRAGRDTAARARWGSPGWGQLCPPGRHSPSCTILGSIRSVCNSPAPKPELL